MRRSLLDFVLLHCFAQLSRRARPFLRIRPKTATVVFIFAAIAFCLRFPEAPAQPRMSEYAVQAAYLLNFGKFVRLSGGARRSAFNICVLGQDPFGSSLDDITANESIDGHPVHILRVLRADAARDCSIAYITASDTHGINEDVSVLNSADVLTVSDAPDFLQHGGMIQFVLISNHVRFNVNLDAVHHSRIALSSELLRVAASVVGQPNGTGEVRP